MKKVLGKFIANIAFMKWKLMGFKPSWRKRTKGILKPGAFIKIKNPNTNSAHKNEVGMLYVKDKDDDNYWVVFWKDGNWSFVRYDNMVVIG